MASDELVKLEVSRCGPHLQDLRLAYIDPAGTNTTNRAASLQHTHYYYIRKAGERMRDIIPDKNSIIFKNCDASGVKLVDGRHYTIEFAPGKGYKAERLAEGLSLPRIRLVGTRNGPSAVKFENSFNRRTWNDEVSSITPASSSYAQRFFLPEPKAMKRESDRDQKRKRESDHDQKRKRTERKKKRKTKKKTSQKRRSGLFCFC